MEYCGGDVLNSIPDILEAGVWEDGDCGGAEFEDVSHSSKGSVKKFRITASVEDKADHVSSVLIAVEYTLDQIRKMEESVQIRKLVEPVELIRLVKQFKKELSVEHSLGFKLPESLKLKLTNEIIDELKNLPLKANVSEQRETNFAERWCNEKLEQDKQLICEKGTLNSTTLLEEAVMLVKALESDRT